MRLGCSPLVLSKPDLLQYLAEGRLVLDPPIDPTHGVQQVSIDLRLGRKFSYFRRDVPAYISGIHVDRSLWGSTDVWEHREQETFRLEPGRFVLAQTLERVRIPNDVVGLVEGRSSYARVGVTVHVTAPKIDPGFDAQITLEMVNFGSIPVDLRAGIDRPAQLILLRLTTPLGEEDLYGRRADDTFQGQEDPIPRPREGCPHALRRPASRPEALELLQHPPRRRSLLRGLLRAAHIPALFEDGRRGAPGIRQADGVRSTTRRSSYATSAASTSSGSRTRAWRLRRTCPLPPRLRSHSSPYSRPSSRSVAFDFCQRSAAALRGVASSIDATTAPIAFCTRS